jgi:feruloyl esterase
MKRKSVVSQLVLTMLAASLAACAGGPGGSTARTGSACTLQSFPELPDVRITSVTEEAVPAAHCKVAGVIGTETNFELLLPDEWNGKFVMGGGGGFVGSVINTALGYGVLQKGYATVGTDTGHRSLRITTATISRAACSSGVRAAVGRR